MNGRDLKFAGRDSEERKSAAADSRPSPDSPIPNPQSRLSSGFPSAVLFDLDGTLLDSAPDMLATANRMRAAHGIGPMALAQLRPHVSRGARAMLGAAFPEVEAAEREGWVGEFLQIYRE